MTNELIPLNLLRESEESIACVALLTNHHY